MTFFPEVSVNLSGERFRVTYHVTEVGQDIEKTALHLAHEQTVELSPSMVPTGDMQQVIGHVESIEAIQAQQYEVVVSYPVEEVGDELPQLMNVIFGNISMIGLMRIHQLDLPASMANKFPGPTFGRQGVRELLNKPEGPLLGTAIKPAGFPTELLAEYAYQFALGGLDIIKDDHGLANQDFSSFKDRALHCAQAVKRANKETGGSALYAPNVTGPVDQIVKRALYAVAAGAGAIEVVPGLVGLDAMRLLAEDPNISVPILGHPGWFGNLTVSPQHGLTMGAIYGQLYRLAGADVSIFTTFGGRFPTTKADCQHLREMLTLEMGDIKPTLPMPGGGMTVERVPALLEFYGYDIIMLISGGLFSIGLDIVENCKTFRRAVDEAVAAYDKKSTFSH